MKLETLNSILGGLPFTYDDRAALLYHFVMKHKPSYCLELGVAHGKATGYIAGALDELGRGKIVGVDIDRCKQRSPSPEETIRKCGLEEYVELRYERSSYTWFLMKKIREQTRGDHCTPVFDFCFLDGAHEWFVDGLAFFLVDKLLKPDGWIIFDDVYWTFARSPSLSHTDRVADMPADEKETPQVRLIIDLLVRQHPEYGEVTLDDQWAYVQKIGSAQREGSGNPA